MDVREKLVDIIQNSVGGCARHWAEIIADGLIANGVTIQEWISVDDRLPKPFTYALVQMPGETPHQTVREGFISRDGVWHSALYDREPDEVTHWMPLPQPPKGE